jgi:hypothetical protein
LAFPSDTSSVLTPTLTDARNSLSALANSGVAGYFLGGQTTNMVSRTEIFSFPTDTKSDTSGIQFARQNAAGLAHSGVAGYNGGGNAVSSERTGFIDKIFFATNVFGSSGSTLSDKKENVAGAANSGIL